eukprot:1038244-Amphidinium_carterae.2
MTSRAYVHPPGKITTKSAFLEEEEDEVAKETETACSTVTCHPAVRRAEPRCALVRHRSLGESWTLALKDARVTASRVQAILNECLKGPPKLNRVAFSRK